MLTKEEKKIRAKKRQEQNIANGKCRGHKNVDLVPGTTMCQNCLDRAKKISKENATKALERQKSRVDSGKCRYHSEKDVVPGKTTCRDCYDNKKNDPRQKEWAELSKKRDNERISQGLCRNCPDKQQVDGTQICQDCRDKNSKRKRKYIPGNCRNHTSREAVFGLKHCLECLDTQRWTHLFNTYGLTKDQYLTECQRLQNKCVICKYDCLPMGETKDRKILFHLDHCHKTGLIRGVICHACNYSLGAFKENEEIIKIFGENVFNYLEKRDIRK